MDNNWVLITKVPNSEGNTLAEVGSFRQGPARSQLGQDIEGSCPMFRCCGATVCRRQRKDFIAGPFSKRSDSFPWRLIILVALE